MTVAGLIKMVQQVLVGGVLCGGSDKAHRLVFIKVKLFALILIKAVVLTPYLF